MKPQRTRSQERILKLLKKQGIEMSAQQVYVSLKEANNPLGLATIYRALDALKLSGAVQARPLSNGETVYSQALEDRHHLTCLQCGTSIPIEEDQCPVHALEKQLRSTAKFEIYYHTLEFFGLCTPCQAAQADSV